MSKNTLNAFRSTSLTADRTAFRCVQTGVRPRVRNLQAVKDTCDGLKKSSHTLVFQSTAAIPPFCRPIFAWSMMKQNEEPLLSRHYLET